MKRVFVLLVLVGLLVTACASGGGATQPTSVVSQSQNPPEPPKPTPTTVPLPDDIPVMTGATDLQVNESDIYYIIKASLNNVVDFYNKEMVAKGWREQEKPSVLGSFGRMYFAKPDKQVSFLLTYSEVLNQVQVRITIIGLNVANPTPMK